VDTPLAQCAHSTTVSLINLFIPDSDCKLQIDLNGQIPINKQDVAMESDSEEYQRPKQIDKIFIIDHHFALNQIDMIENCDVLSNVVLPDSVLKHLNKQ
jgi:hypothetical protein